MPCLQFKMFRWWVLPFALLISNTNLSFGSVPLSVCPAAPKVVGENSVSVYGSRESSKWVTTILSNFGTEGSAESPNLDVSQKIIRCEDKEILQVKVVLREQIEGESSDISGSWGKKYHTTRVSTLRKDAIRFHESGGRNILVFDEGLTVYRKNEDTELGYAGILTNRTLQDDELFEVTLERVIKAHGEYLGIGVTTHSPTTMDYGIWLSTATVMLFNHKVYGKEPKNAYGPDLRKLQVGSRIGVMRKRNGNVHFYIDGVDQGIAAINVPGPVYGALDLYGDTVQASIALD